MPELPEVETIVRDLRPIVTGRVLQRPRLYHSDVLCRITKPALLRGLARRRIENISRRAKHAVLLLDSGSRLIIQPGMSGSLLTYDRPLTAAERKYAVLTADIGRGTTLVYRDVRRLGTIYLLDQEGWDAYTGRIGPEPLEEGFDARVFAGILGRSRQAIKKVIMDQRKLAGVGNIYANEALFRARVNPWMPALEVERAAARKLHGEIRKVLAQAIESKGTTFRDYRRGTGERGGFQLKLYVYGREGEPCRTLLTGTHDIDGRATTFCRRCQGVAR